MSKHSYSFKAFNDVIVQFNNLIEKKGLDPKQCTIDIMDGPEDEMIILFHDNISRELYGMGISKEHVLKTNYKWLAEDGTLSVAD